MPIKPRTAYRSAAVKNAAAGRRPLESPIGKHSSSRAYESCSAGLTTLALLAGASQRLSLPEDANRAMSVCVEPIGPIASAVIASDTMPWTDGSISYTGFR